MVTPELIEYIKTRLNAAEDPQSIQQNLKTSGWSEEDIQSAFSQTTSYENIGIDQPAVVVQPDHHHHLNKKLVISGILGLLLVGGGVFAATYFIPPSPEKVLKTARVKMNTINSFDFSGSITADVSAPTGLFSMDTLLHGLNNKNLDSRIAGTSSEKVSMDFSGSTDVRDINYPKAQLNLDFGYSIFNFGLEIRVLDTVYYIKFDHLPDMEGYQLGKYSGNWIKIDSDSIAQQYGFDVDTTSRPPDLTEGQKKQLQDLFNSAHFFNKITRLDDDTIDGGSMYRYALDVDMAGLKQYLTAAAKIEDAAGSVEANPVKDLEYIKISNAEVWIGKSDNLLHRASAQMTGSDGQSGSVPDVTVAMNFLVNIKNFNNPTVILEPQDFKNITDVITEISQSFIPSAQTNPPVPK